MALQKFKSEVDGGFNERYLENILYDFHINENWYAMGITSMYIQGNELKILRHSHLSGDKKFLHNYKDEILNIYALSTLEDNSIYPIVSIVGFPQRSINQIKVFGNIVYMLHGEGIDIIDIKDSTIKHLGLNTEDASNLFVYQGNICVLYRKKIVIINTDGSSVQIDGRFEGFTVVNNGILCVTTKSTISLIDIKSNTHQSVKNIYGAVYTAITNKGLLCISPKSIIFPSGNVLRVEDIPLPLGKDKVDISGPTGMLSLASRANINKEGNLLICSVFVRGVLEGKPIMLGVPVIIDIAKELIVEVVNIKNIAIEVGFLEPQFVEPIEHIVIDYNNLV
jgi:hypothetical protein